LAKLLLSHLSTKSAGQGVNQIEQRFSNNMPHEEIARQIGSSRETVSRALAHLKNAEIISLHRQALVIHDRLALEHLAG